MDGLIEENRRRLDVLCIVLRELPTIFTTGIESPKTSMRVVAVPHISKKLHNLAQNW